MIREVGTLVQLRTVIKDLAGAAVNTPTLTLSVTAPDLTTSAPAVTNTASSGLYTATLLPTQVGLYRYTWTASGTVVDVQSDQLSVIAAQRALVCSLEELKHHINRFDAGDDAALRSILIASTDWVEWRIGGPLARTSFTERLRTAGTHLQQRHHPLVTVTSVTPQYGGALPASSYAVDTTNSQIELLYGGYGWYTVVYAAGPAGIAENVKLAGQEVARHLWRVRNGTAGRGTPDDDVIMTPMGFAVPRRAEELLAARDMAIPGFA